MIPPGEAAAAAAKTAAAGFKALKLKVGWPTLAEDLAVIRAARKPLGGEAALMVDYNQSLAIPEAIRRGRVLDGEGVAWIEYLDVAAPILAEPLRPVDGAITAPARPGIGIAWNEEAVRRYAV